MEEEEDGRSHVQTFISVSEEVEMIDGFVQPLVGKTMVRYSWWTEVEVLVCAHA